MLSTETLREGTVGIGDGCEDEVHLACAGLCDVPSGDWFCESCTESGKGTAKAGGGGGAGDDDASSSSKSSDEEREEEEEEEEDLLTVNKE